MTEAAAVAQAETPTQTTSSTPDTSAAPVTQPATDWTSTLAKEEADYVKNKGWKEPKAILNSYKELEKFRGADEKSIVKIPSKDAKPEELDAFYNKLGRPESADKYELKIAEGQQIDEGMLTEFKQLAHKRGLKNEDVQALYDWKDAKDKEAVLKYNENRKAEHEKQLNFLKEEWGANYTANEEYARRGGKSLGLSEADMNEIGDAIGTARLYKMLSNAGIVSGEIKRPDTGTNTATSADQEAAIQKINELSANKEFSRKLNVDKDTATINEWKALHERAYPNKK